MPVLLGWVIDLDKLKLMSNVGSRTTVLLGLAMWLMGPLYFYRNEGNLL